MYRFLIFTILSLFIYADDTIKGQTYYQYLLKDKLGYNGAVFSKKYTKKEWEQLFSNDAKALKTFLHQENPTLQNFTNSDKFKKITPFLKAFVTTYAKDIKNSPSCK